MTRALSPEDHAARLDIITEGRAAGRSTGQIAAQLGMSASALSPWIARHCPHLSARPGRPQLTDAEHDHRYEVAAAARAEGVAWVTIAQRLDLAASSLASWVARYAPDLRDIGPSEPEPEPDPGDPPVTIHRETGTWLVACARCRRAFTRPSRSRARRLRDLHDRCCHPERTPA